MSRQERPHTTMEQRMYATYKAAYTYDWIRRGEGPGPLLAVAWAFKMPIVQVRGIINEEKARRRESRQTT